MTGKEIYDAMDRWREERGWWFCIDCGTKLTGPQPVGPPFHYMCPVATAQEVIEYEKLR